MRTGTPAVRHHICFIRNPSCPPSPQHLTGISVVLQHSLLSSLLFHQNIADEVLSSINHSAALLQSPSINQRVCRTAGPGLLVLLPDVLKPLIAFTYKHIQDGTFRSLVYFGFRKQAGLLHNVKEDCFLTGSLGCTGTQSGKL